MTGPHQTTSKNFFLILLAICGLYALYFAGLGANPLMDPDEPIYGQFVKEMVTKGDWLTPHYNGHLWFDKPPLFYWLSGISVKCFGLNEFAVRFPSAFFAVGIVLMVYLLTKYDFGKRAGVYASLVIATTMMQLVMSHAAATDTIMVFLTTAALYAYRRWLDDTSPKRILWMAACGVATGFGMLTKGPVVPVLLMGAFILHLLWIHEIGKLKAKDVLVGVSTTLVIGLPWYIAMYLMHGKAFVDGFIIANNIARFAKPLHKSQTGSWYSYFRNIPILLGFFIPWSAFLPQAIAGNWRANKGSKLLAAWFAVVVVFFSISKTQNFTYTYPVFPAGAAFVGVLLSSAWRSESKRVNSVWTGVIVNLFISLLLAAALVIFVFKKYPGAHIAAILMASALLAAPVITILGTLTRKMRIADTVWVTSAAMLVFILVLLYGAMPVVSQWKSSRNMSDQISKLHNTKVVAFSLWRPGLLYYMNREPIAVDDPKDIHNLIRSKVPSVIICSERDERHVENPGAVELFGCGDLDAYANPAYITHISASATSHKNRTSHTLVALRAACSTSGL